MTQFIEDRNFRRNLYRSLPVKLILADKAEQVKTAAEASAPRDSGEYASSFRSDVGEDERGFTVGRVWTEHPAGDWIEFGTSDTPKHATLRKALDSI